MTAGNPPFPWRSILFVPAHVPKFVDKAGASAADAVQLDLEDSVPPNSKLEARERLPQAAQRLRELGKDVLVRINRPLTLAVADLQAAVRCSASVVSVTKADSAQHLRLLAEVLDEEEARIGAAARGRTRMIAIVETPEAFGRLAEIAAATPRMMGMMLGGEDFALGCGVEPEEEVMLGPKQAMVIAACGAGIAPLGYIGSIANFRDLDGYRAMVRRSRRFGFVGGTCIHPTQAPILNEEFGVSTEALIYARRVIEGFDTALAAGLGAFQLDGKMIDLPIVDRARRLLERAAAFEARKVKAPAGSA